MSSYVRFLAIVLVLGLTSLFSGNAVADVVIAHNGALDPLTEGWSVVGGTLPAGVTAGPVFDDLGSGVDAWVVDDRAAYQGGGGGYAYTLMPDEVGQAATDGWTLTATLRVIDVSLADSPVSVWFEAGSTRWHMLFGTDSEGNATIQLLTGSDAGGAIGPGPHAVNDDGYHEYRLVHDPFTASADLFIDGVETITDYTGFAHTFTPRVAFGSGSSFETGTGHYNRVVLRIGPPDADGDGIRDAEDGCPDSDLGETIVIAGCDTDVDNDLFDDGCTMSDGIVGCVGGAENHGDFVSCVANLANDWKKDWLITGRDKGAIQSCAGQAELP